MKRAITSIILILSLANVFVVAQIIKGRIVSKFADDYYGLPWVTINTGTISSNTGFEGFYSFNVLKSDIDSIIFQGSLYATIKIINLPTYFDTLNLGTIEMIDHKSISVEQYDSIRNNLIRTFKPDIIIVQRSKADKMLHNKYMPAYDWNVLIGYIVQDEVSVNEMINPYDKNKKIKFEYDNFHNLISLDYHKLIE